MKYDMLQQHTYIGEMSVGSANRKSADPGRQQGGARQGREVVNTKTIHNNNSSIVIRRPRQTQGGAR